VTEAPPGGGRAPRVVLIRPTSQKEAAANFVLTAFWEVRGLRNLRVLQYAPSG
jgi:hypothetical protein